MRGFAAGRRVPVVAGATTCLPAVVRESLVGLRHPVDVVLLLVGAPLLIEGVHELAGEFLWHSFFPAVARVLDEPTQRKRTRTALRDLDGYLVVGTSDTARANLENRRHALDGLLEDLELR